MGASAGGVETLRRVISGLPPDLPAAVCIVLHLAPGTPSLLARILDRAGRLRCHAAHEAEPLRNGEILVAPPDRHLVVEDEHVYLSVGPRENGLRPSVDVLFRSAAAAKGTRVVGVILSGSRGDGALGLAAVKAAGGATVVQDPEEALYAGMPSTALAHVAVDAIVPSERIAETIVAMVKGDDPPPTAAENELQLARFPGDPEATICPECGGVLTERKEAGVKFWQCRVGHRYSPEGLVDAQALDVEAALWAAVRTLEDRARLLDRMAERYEPRGHTRSIRSFREKAAAARSQAEAVRAALTGSEAVSLAKSEEITDDGEDLEIKRTAEGRAP